MTRRQRLARIIRAYSSSHPGPGFTVTIGNSYQHNPFAGRDVLDMLTDEALEIVARDLVQREAERKRRNERNRAILAGRAS